MFVRLIVVMIAPGLLVGCGLAGTGGTAAVHGAATAEETKAAGKQLDKVQADVDAAQKKAAEVRQAADVAE
jgi:hypothetical protein